MGNKLSHRRALVEEHYTKPQGLYQNLHNFNQKKLRRLILDGKLAPCYPGAEDPSTTLEECPICFLSYPSLNRSKCCTKSICTECFLQMKPPGPSRPPQCPYCKSPNYAVEYRGAKTVEEKGMEQMEEQKVIEAKIRMQQTELQEEQQRMLTGDEHEGEDRIPGELDARNEMDSNPESILNEHCQSRTSLFTGRSSARAYVGTSGSSISRSNRDEFHLDLEDIMVMEAIWLSIQEQELSSQQNSDTVREGASVRITPSKQSSCEGDRSSDVRGQGRNSVTGGLAGAIAALAERQALNSGDVLDSSETTGALSVDRITSSVPVNREGGLNERMRNGSRSNRDVDAGHNGYNRELNSWIEVSVETGRTLSPHRRDESHGSYSSEAVEVGTSFSSSVPSASELPWEAPEHGNEHEHEGEGGGEEEEEEEEEGAPPLILNPEGGANLLGLASSSAMAESFEEQMMRAMALSLTQAQAQTRY